MKGIILYQSKYGATKKYADWIIQIRCYKKIRRLDIGSYGI